MENIGIRLVDILLLTDVSSKNDGIFWLGARRGEQLPYIVQKRSLQSLSYNRMENVQGVTKLFLFSSY